MDWAIVITGKCWWGKWMEKNGPSHRHHHQHHQCLWIWFQMFGGSTLWFWVGWPHRFDPFLHRSWFQASKRLPVRVSMTCSIVKHIVTWCWGPAIPPEIGYFMARIMMHQPSSESWPTHSTPTVGWTWLWQRRNHGRGNWHSQMKMGEMGNYGKLFEHLEWKETNCQYSWFLMALVLSFRHSDAFVPVATSVNWKHQKWYSAGSTLQFLVWICLTHDTTFRTFVVVNTSSNIGNRGSSRPGQTWKCIRQVWAAV